MFSKTFILLIVTILLVNDSQQNDICYINKPIACDKKHQTECSSTICSGMYKISCGTKHCAKNKLSCAVFRSKRAISNLNIGSFQNCPIVQQINNKNSINVPCLDRFGCDLKQMRDWNWRNKVMSKI